MATKQDKEIIRSMAGALQLYLMRNYPIEYMHEDREEYSFSMMAIASPYTGKLLLTKMSKADSPTTLYRMDHEDMQTPEGIVIAFQEEFRSMYEQTAQCFAEQGNYGSAMEV